MQPGIGPITGNAERDLRVVKELVGLDWGTVLDKRNPADFAEWRPW